MNEKRKNRYLAYRDKLYEGEDTVQNAIESYFRRAAFFEEIFNKDLAEFTTNEIQQFYKTLFTSSINTLRTMNAQFSLYTEWCIKEGLVKDHQNHYSEIDAPDYADWINTSKAKKQFITRDELLDILRTVDRYQLKVSILGAFEGIKGKDFQEILELTKDDLTKPDEVYIKSRGKYVPVSHQLYVWMQEAVRENKKSACAYGHIYEKGYPESERDYVYKISELETRRDVNNGKRNAPAKQIYTLLRKSLNGYTGDRDARAITASNISDSGIVDFINRKAKENNETPLDYFNSPKFIQDAKNQYNRTIIRSNFFPKYRDYIRG